jgi:hypothetical protein
MSLKNDTINYHLKFLDTSYSGGKDQENDGLRPTQANSSQDPISKKPITKMGCWSGSRCRP